MTIGERIQRARKAANMSQKELGEKLGVSASMIGQYESNFRKPKIERLLCIARILSVPASELMENMVDAMFENDIDDVITITTSKGDTISLSKNSLEGELLSNFILLNEAGQKKAIERVEELAEIPKYQSKYYYYYDFSSSDTKKETPPEDPEA